MTWLECSCARSRSCSCAVRGAGGSAAKRLPATTAPDWNGADVLLDPVPGSAASWERGYANRCVSATNGARSSGGRGRLLAAKRLRHCAGRTWIDARPAMDPRGATAECCHSGSGWNMWSQRLSRRPTRPRGAGWSSRRRPCRRSRRWCRWTVLRILRQVGVECGCGPRARPHRRCGHRCGRRVVRSKSRASIANEDWVTRRFVRARRSARRKLLVGTRLPPHRGPHVRPWGLSPRGSERWTRSRMNLRSTSGAPADDVVQEEASGG